jgi:hypothetical protein
VMENVVQPVILLPPGRQQLVFRVQSGDPAQLGLYLFTGLPFAPTPSPAWPAGTANRTLPAR